MAIYVVECQKEEYFKYLLKKSTYSSIWHCREWNEYKESTYLEFNEKELNYYGKIEDFSQPKITFKEYCSIMNYDYFNNQKENRMKKLIQDVLESTYNNDILRHRTVPLFMGNPGLGKSQTIKEFAKAKGVRLHKLTLSQRMPNEVAGGLMPDTKTKTWEVYDSHELGLLKDGDILFLDEIFNGTLKQTLDAVLNLLEDRVLPSGKKMADVMIVAASNFQGLISLTPQIKERFIMYKLKFKPEEYQAYLKNEFGIPENISKHFCTLINKETFENENWNFNTPRSIEKAIQQVAVGAPSPIEDLIIPFLKEKIKAPLNSSEIKDLPKNSIKFEKDEEIEFLEFLKLIMSIKNNKNK